MQIMQFNMTTRIFLTKTLLTKKHFLLVSITKIFLSKPMLCLDVPDAFAKQGTTAHYSTTY